MAPEMVVPEEEIPEQGEEEAVVPVGEIPEPEEMMASLGKRWVPGTAGGAAVVGDRPFLPTSGQRCRPGPDSPRIAH